MKRTLVLIGAIGLVASSFSTLISCGTPTQLAVNPNNNSLDGLKLNINFDSEEENDYDYIKDQVKKVIKKFNPTAQFNKDYEISHREFNLLTRKVIKPGYVKVSATFDSEILIGSFNVLVYKDLDAEIKAANLANQGTFNKGIETKNIIKQMLEESKLTDKNNLYYEFLTDPNNSGSWTIRSVGVDLIVKVNFSFRQTMDAFDLTKLQNELPDLKVNEKTLDQLNQEVNYLIKNASVNNRNIQQDVDYQIVGDPRIGDSQILVESLSQGEHLLIGSFTIQVAKESIIGLEINDYLPHPPNVLMSKNEILGLIYAVLEYHYKNFDLVLNIDYEVEFNDGWVEVKALESSNYISGSFSFELEPK